MPRTPSSFTAAKRYNAGVGGAKTNRLQTRAGLFDFNANSSFVRHIVFLIPSLMHQIFLPYAAAPSSLNIIRVDYIQAGEILFQEIYKQSHHIFHSGFTGGAPTESAARLGFFLVIERITANFEPISPAHYRKEV